MIAEANRIALEKRNINWIYMYDFRGVIKGKFRDLNDAATKLNKTTASISNYIKKENRFDGMHFLCRRK